MRIEHLFDDYNESSVASRTSAPFLLERNGKLSLHFHKTGVQSLMNLEAPEELLLGYTRTMMKFLLFNEQPKHIGMVGLGGGSLAKYCYEHLPETRITVAEISPEVIAFRRQFRIPSDNARFQVICEDGADFVRSHRSEFDVLIIDGFDLKGQPPELCSQDFYHSCFDALAAKGILVVNICDSGRSLLVSRLRRSFDDRVLVVDGEDSTNTIAFAARNTAELDRTKLASKGLKISCKTPSVASRPSFFRRSPIRRASPSSSNSGSVNFRPER